MGRNFFKDLLNSHLSKIIKTQFFILTDALGQLLINYNKKVLISLL